MPGLASPGRVPALAVDSWSLKKSKLAFQRTPQGSGGKPKNGQSEPNKTEFLGNYKIRVGLQEEMLLARSKEEGDET